MIYFRVHEDSNDKIGKLYDRYFKATARQPQSDDLVITSSWAHFQQITEANPKTIILRVHASKTNRDVLQGDYYDENFELLDAGLPDGNPVILTITPEEFSAVKQTKQ